MNCSLVLVLLLSINVVINEGRRFGASNVISNGAVLDTAESISHDILKPCEFVFLKNISVQIFVYAGN